MVGCGPVKPEGPLTVHPVSGQVLFAGKPLAGARVTLVPVEGPASADAGPRPTGETDESGRFRLMTYTRDDGAPAGQYRVTVTGLGRPSREGSVLLGPSGHVAKTDVLQGRYLDPKNSGLRAEVKPGENTLPPFELK